jgi:hypothetical protein
MIVEKTARQLASDDKQSMDGASQAKQKHASHHLRFRAQRGKKEVLCGIYRQSTS